MTVTSQELLDTKCGGVMVRPDKYDISEPMSNQLNPAQDKSSHQNVAELAVCLHQSKQILTIYFDDFASTGCANLDEPAPPRKDVDFACELSRPEDSYQLAALG